MEEEDVNWDYGEDGNALATCLEIGDNFVVNAIANNDEGQEFWLIRCSKPLHKVNKNFTNAWGTSRKPPFFNQKFSTTCHLQLCFNNIYKKIKYNHGNYQLS